MSISDYDRPPRDDILPSPEEIRRTRLSTPPHPDEFDAPDDLKLDEEHVTRAKMPPVTWAQSDSDAPDYAHLVPKGREPVPGDKQFRIGAADIELLIKANGFDPKGPNTRIVFAFRGANLIDREDKNNDGAVAAVDVIQLEETRPDHKNFRCVIGYLNRTTGKISAFRASTVPNVKYMTNYYMSNNGLGGNSGTGANMMPTGCYVFRMGAHGGGRIYPAMRLTDPEKLAEDGAACVLRSKNDLTFKTDDLFDHCTPYNNIHCAYAYDSFSSAGCQTIQGPNGEGPWGHFQAVLKTIKINTRMDYLLLTGREASIAAWLRDIGKAGDAEMVAKWLGRLRPGSRGDAVSRLQQQLSLPTSGYFGPSTKKKLVDVQRSKKLLSDGIWSPMAEESFGWSIFKPAAALQPTPTPAASSAATPTQPPAAAPVPQPPTMATPAPAVSPPPSPSPPPAVAAEPAAPIAAAAAAEPRPAPSAPTPPPPAPMPAAAASSAAAKPKPAGVSDAFAAELEKLQAAPDSSPEAPGIVDIAGNLPVVLQSSRAALAIAERLVKADPGNVGWQRDLSVSHGRIGEVLRVQGNLPAALQSYRAAVAIAERLVKADPGNVSWQRDLFLSHERIGDVLRTQANPTAALQSYRAALAIDERLVESDPGNAGWQRDLSLSHDKVGDLLIDQGNLPGALQNYRAALAIAERLSEVDPGNAGWQRDVALSHGRVAVVIARHGSRDEARKMFEQGRTIIARLNAALPDDVTLPRDLAWFESQIADLNE